MFLLTFHGIGEPPVGARVNDDERDVWVSHARFLEILDLIADRDDVELTFDDGNKSDSSLALPALNERGLKAKFFVCAGRLKLANYLDQHDVRELLRSGMSVGSHGMHHLPWSKLPSEELQREVFDAKTMLEDVAGSRIDEAACPYGAYDRRSLHALREAGFERVYTSDGGSAEPRQWLMARNTVLRTDSAATIEARLNSRQTVPFVKQAKRWIKQFR